MTQDAVSFYPSLTPGETLSSGQLALRDVPVGDLADKSRVGVEQHDMKVFNSVNRLQTIPVLEPDDLRRSVHIPIP